MKELGETSISVIQLNIETNMKKAWELHLLLNGKPAPQNGRRAKGISGAMDLHIHHADLFQHLDRLTKPVSNLLMAKLLKKKLDEMPFALQKGTYELLSYVWR